MALFSGEIAALATSLFFTATSTQFTLAGREVGSVVVNRTRLLLAIGWLALAHLLFKIPLPFNTESNRWLWLGLSGIVGLVIGDTMLFQAFVWIGPRLSMLLMSLAPIISTIIAWVFLGEVLSYMQISAILITVGSIAWVILERNARTLSITNNPNYGRGVFYGFGAAISQALGLVFAKQGLLGSFSPISGTFIRMFIAAIALWSITIVSKQASQTVHSVLTHHKARWFLLGGSFTGPFLGVTLSLFAVQHTKIGIASTLMALPPLFLLPVGYFIFQEQIGMRAIIGTCIAIFGVALLFLA